MLAPLAGCSLPRGCKAQWQGEWPEIPRFATVLAWHYVGARDSL
jgi:hypothetical protein